jgi:hypothetical protein
VLRGVHRPYAPRHTGLRRVKSDSGLPPSTQGVSQCHMSRCLLWMLLSMLSTFMAMAHPTTAFAGLSTGFVDPAYESPIPAVRQLQLTRTVRLGATVVRLNVAWNAIAPPSPPPVDFRAADPSEPRYNWASIDSAVRDATDLGLRPLITIFDAPTWAEGPGRPSDAPAGSWLPNIGDLAAFAHAAALRYSGAFPDPQRPGRNLARVGLWQIWNEPNLWLYLSPQYVSQGRRRVAIAADYYRGMLNAAYTSIKAVSPNASIVTAGTAPYGDYTAPWNRTPPVAFLRDLVCVNTSFRPLSCPGLPHFDILAHHPYAVSSPRTHALNRDDAAVPDIARLTRVLRSAIRLGHVRPAGRKRVWVTEFSWDSAPPDPGGVPMRRLVHWVGEALFLMWSQGVDTVIWQTVTDAPPVPTFDSTVQAGPLFADGTPKPIAAALSFPFYVERVDSRRVRVWGRAPGSGVVEIKALRHGRWRPLASIHVPAPRAVFDTSVVLIGPAIVRGTQSGVSTIPLLARA